ncbi:hypothetical protein Dimus_014631, partial [Dionaea muscipula]
MAASGGRREHEEALRLGGAADPPAGSGAYADGFTSCGRGRARSGVPAANNNVVH